MILTTSAMLLLTHSLLSTSLHSIEPSSMGLTSELPLSFWIGIASLGCLWFSSENSKNYRIVALMLTVVFLYLAPGLMRTPVWLSASYYPFGESVHLSQIGHLVDEPGSIYLNYHSWPAFLFFSSIFTQVTGMPHYLVLKFFPQVIIALFALLTFSILRVKFRASSALIGASLFLGSFFLRHYYFGPACVVYILYLSALLLLSKLFFCRRAEKTKLETLFLFLFIVTTFSHALTSLILLMVLVALYISERLVGRSTGVTSRLCLITAIILLSYNLFIATAAHEISYPNYNIVEATLSSFVDIFLGDRPLGVFQEQTRILGSSANRITYYSYLGIILLNGAVALVAVVQVIREVRSSRKSAAVQFPLFWVILLVLLGVFAVSAQYGPHEAYQRAFMFGLIPLSFLSLKLLSKRPKILLCVLTGLLFLNIPAQYGADSYTLATSTQLAGSDFVAHYTPNMRELNDTATAIICFHKFSLYVRYYTPEKFVRFVSVGDLPFSHFPNSSRVLEVMNRSDYIILSDIQSNYFIYFLNDDPLQYVQYDWLNRIYDSGSYHTFINPNRNLTQ